ncbi:hypothetical protein V6N13_073796 [Hibiscus sabdariffa]
MTSKLSLNSSSIRRDYYGNRNPTQSGSLMGITIQPIYITKHNIARAFEPKSIPGCFPIVPHSSMVALNATFSPKAIHEALCEMALLKALGHDSLHVEFYQKQWHVFGGNVYRTIQSVFQGGDLEPIFNSISLVLIPKE